MVMEQSASSTRIEYDDDECRKNNAAPWQYNQADRLNWANEN